MSSFTNQLAQMVAAARLPVVGHSSGQRFVGNVNAKLTPGGFGLGTAASEFGRGVGQAFEEYGRYDFPQQIRERALKLYELLSDPEVFTPEKRKKLLSYPTVQKQLKEYQQLAPEYFQTDENGRVDIIPHEPSARAGETRAKEKLYSAQAGLVEKTTPYIAQSRKAESILKDLEARLATSTEGASKEKILLDVKRARQEVQNLKDEAERASKKFPVELKSLKARTGYTQAQADLTGEKVKTEQVMRPVREAQGLAQAQVSTGEAEKLRQLTPIQAEALAQQSALYQKQQMYYDAQMQAKLLTAKTKENEEQFKIYQDLFKTRMEEDKALRDKYSFTVQFDPKSYAMEDAAYTQAMVEPMGKTNFAVGRDPSTGKQYFVQMPAVFSSPTAQFWVNKSLSELYSAYLHEMPKGDTGSLAAVLEKYQDLFKVTYGSYTPEIKAAAPFLKPDGYDTAYKQYAYMALRFDDLLPPGDPGHLSDELRDRYEKITGGMAPVPPEDIPLATDQGGMWRAIKKMLNR